MPTLLQYRRRMVQIDPDLGRVFPINSLTVNSAVVTALNVGEGPAPDRWSQLWMLRGEATSQPADRLRFSVDYNPNTGAVFHRGADYSDTSGTDEELELLEHHPSELEESIQQSLQTTAHPDDSELPANSAGLYFLNSLSWITSPADVLKVGYLTSNVFTPNRFMEKWNGFDETNANGRLTPDLWTPGYEAASSFTQSTTTRRGGRSLSIARAGTDVTFLYRYRNDATGVLSDGLENEKVTGVMVALANVASAARLRVESYVPGTGNTTSNTSYHTGGGDWEELSVEHTVPDNAIYTDVIVRIEQNDTVLIDEVYGTRGSLTDTERRGRRGTLWVDEHPYTEQGQSGFLLHGPRARGRRLIVRTQRPYAPFTASRLQGGTADADTHNAPLDLIAYGALAHFWEGKGERGKAARFRSDWAWRAAEHLGTSDDRLTDHMLRAPTPITGRVR